jgi:hypothetical protein
MKRFIIYVPRIYNSCTSYTTENIDYLIVVVDKITIITLGYARPPKVRDISFKYYPHPLVVAPTFWTRF